MKDSCIHIDLISAGWIDGMIHDEQAKIIFSNSYFDNFLDDFMLAVLTVLGEYPADYHKEIPDSAKLKHPPLYKTA